MGRPETLESIKTLRVGGVLFIPIPEGKSQETLLKTFNLKCWREAKKKGREFKLSYDSKWNEELEQMQDGIKIKRTL